MEMLSLHIIDYWQH